MIQKTLMMLMLAAMAFGQSSAASKAPAKASAAAPAKKLDIPAGARQVAEGTWEYTDAQGKEWVFKQMPFGLTKMAKADLDARSATPLPEGMSVVETGGAYKFTRRTPFGAVNYLRKADELNETERALVAALNRKSGKEIPAAKQTAAK